MATAVCVTFAGDNARLTTPTGLQPRPLSEATVAVVMLFLVGARLVNAKPAPAPDADRMRRWQHEIALGDEAYRQRGDAAQAAAALQHYRVAFGLRPDDSQSAWRVGMAAYFMGERLATTASEKQRLWAEGRDAAQRGVALDPNCAPCHFWTAINMALYGDSVGALKMLFSLRSIRQHLERTLALDPTYAYGGAHRILGAIDRKLPGILGGSKKRARAHFDAAIVDSPDEPLNYLFLAELLANDLKDRQGAIAAARRGLQVPPPGPERLESIDCLAETRQFLERLGAAPQDITLDPPR